MDNNGRICCVYCGGAGFIPAKCKRSDWPIKCPKCKGDGYFDWIENIIGKKPEKPFLTKEIWEGYGFGK